MREPKLSSVKKTAFAELRNWGLLLALGSHLAACAKDLQRSIEPGKTSSEQLVQQLGPAEVAGVSPSRSTAEQRTYSDCEYQVEGSQVVSKFCLPREHERTLQYWRQLWRDRETEFTAVDEGQSPHGPERFIFRIKGGSQAVIYSKSRDRILQVIDYATSNQEGN